MDKEQLLKILNDNQVKYEKDIEKAKTEGYANDESADLAEEIYSHLYRFALYGVQKGFSKCADDIKELTKLIASLVCGTTKKAVNLSKTRAKCEAVLKRATYLKEKGEINMDMINQLMANIDDCIAATDAIMQVRKDMPDLCARLKESKKVLLQMKEELGNVADVTSRAAAEYQVKIFDILMSWRAEACRYSCYSDSVEKLKGALEIAKAWRALSASVRKTAKKDEYYSYSEDYDEISYIISAGRYAERTKHMRAQLDEFRKQTDSFYSKEALTAELEKLQEDYNKKRTGITSRLAEIKKQIDAKLIEYQNGEGDPVLIDIEVTGLSEESERLNDELVELQERYDDRSFDLMTSLKDATSGSSVRDEIARNFEKFISRLESYRNVDPAMFGLLCSKVDFNGIYDTLSGRCTAEQVAEVYIRVETIIQETEDDLKRQRRTLKGFKDIYDKMHGKRVEEERIFREQEKARKEQQRKQAATAGSHYADPAQRDKDARKRLDAMINKNGAPQQPTRNVGGTIKINNDDK